MSAPCLVFRLPVGDLRRSIEFYVNDLGLQLSFGPHPRTGDTYYLSADGNGGRIALDPVPGGRVTTCGRRGPTFEFSTSRLWSFHARVRAAGVRATDIAEPDPASPQFDLTDPDDHVVRVHQVPRGRPTNISLGSVEKPEQFHAVLRRELGFGDAYDGAWATLSRLLAREDPRPPRKLVVKDWGSFRARFPDHADGFVKTIAAHNAAHVDWTVRLIFEDLPVA